MAIVGYNSLRSKVGTWLNRQDLTDQIPTFVRLAEESLAADDRVRRLVVVDPFEVTERDTPLPEGFAKLEAPLRVKGEMGHALDIVTPGELEEIARRPVPVRPRAAAVIGNHTLRLAPFDEDSDPVELSLSYWQAVHPFLATGIQTNWLLAEHSRIYLYATLLESAPFLRDDQRLQTWGTLMEDAISKLERRNQEAMFSGGATMTRPRPYRAIGG